MKQYTKHLLFISMLMIASVLGSPLQAHAASNTIERDLQEAPMNIAPGDDLFHDSYGEEPEKAVADINGDGINDLLVGSQNSGVDDNGDATQRGAVYVYLGSDDGLNLAFTITGAEEGNNFGSSLYAFTDLTGDEKADIAIAAESANEVIGEDYIITSETFAELLSSVEIGGTISITDVEKVTIHDSEEELGSYLEPLITEYTASDGTHYYLWISRFGNQNFTGDIYVFTDATMESMVQHTDEVQYLKTWADAIIENEAEVDGSAFNAGTFTAIHPWEGTPYLIIANQNYINNTGRAHIITETALENLVASNPESDNPMLISDIDALQLDGNAEGVHFTYQVEFVTQGDDTRYVVISAPYYENQTGAMYAMSEEYITQQIAAAEEDLDETRVAEEESPYKVHGENEGDFFGEEVRVADNAKKQDLVFALAANYLDSEEVSTIGKVYVFTGKSLESSREDVEDELTECGTADECDYRAIVGRHSDNSSDTINTIDVTPVDLDRKKDKRKELVIGSAATPDEKGAVHVFRSTTYLKGHRTLALAKADNTVVGTAGDSNFGTYIEFLNLNGKKAKDLFVPMARYGEADMGAFEVLYDVTKHWVVAKPNKPRKLATEEITNASAQLQWKAPKHSVVTKYTVQVRVHSNEDEAGWTTMQKKNKLLKKVIKQNVEALGANTSYEWRVQAVNGAGKSAYTDWQTFTTLMQ